MFTRIWLWLVLVSSSVVISAGLGTAVVSADTAAVPIDIGSRLELLLDDYLIASTQNIKFQLHSPQTREQTLAFDKPWEKGSGCDYVTVFHDEDRYRMYYACHLGVPRNEWYGAENQLTCYAESRDGVHWTKPALGLIEFEGSKENNILLRGAASHNFTPFIDTKPQVPPDQKYKGVGGLEKPDLLASADALHWRKIGELPSLWKDGAYDSQNVIFWDTIGKQYVFYFRIWLGGSRRHIARSTSSDFLTWSKAQPIDLGQTPEEHLYTNATIQYFRAPHVYLAFPMRYVPSHRTLVAELEKRLRGVCDAVFMFSRDGLHFHRYMEAFMRPGPNPRNWTKHSVMIASGLLPLTEDEISLYVSQHYLTGTDHLVRAVLRTDGFVSVQAPLAGGEFVTKPIVFSGRKLVINAETSAAGSIRAEIQDGEGKPLEGYRLEDCILFYGDTTAHTVQWKNGSDIGPLAGKPVKLRFAIKDADLYSIQFCN